MLKKLICTALAVAMLCLLPGCLYQTGSKPSSGITDAPAQFDIQAAVVYSGGEDWKDTVFYLEQSPMLGLSVHALPASENADLSAYDILYLDDSLLDSAPAGFFESVQSYTHNGGAVFLTNALCEVFPMEYLGISGLQKLSGFCTEPAYPDCGPDTAALQQILRDYALLYTQYADFQTLQQQDYGWGVTTDTAQNLVTWDDAGIYTLNQYGSGYVFLTNPLLPSAYSTGSLTMELVEGKSTFASTTASFNRLLLCGFAEFVAKQFHGYALERVFGYFGTPSMAWELHYEEITGIANGSMQIFSELCRQYNQIPSFTLIRNSYTWFLRAESVTFLLNQSQEGFDFQMDLNENAYSSGTHIDAGGQWLSLGYLEEENKSYFQDYPEYTLRAYPQAVDLNADQLTDILCGSADGLLYFFPGTGFHSGRLHTEKPTVLCGPDGEPLRFGGYSAPRAADLNHDGFADLICGWDDGKIRWFSGDGTGTFTFRDVLLDTGICGQALPAIGDVNGDSILDLAVGSDNGTLLLCYGNSSKDGAVCFSGSGIRDLSGIANHADLGPWLAPAFTDWNGDGITDLAVGVFHGYIAILIGHPDGSFRFDGYITADEMDYKGSHNLKFGNWAVPSFADLDKDGQADLLCGSLEYGIAYPIDSEYFPYRKQLQEQVDYAREHEYYVGVHFYTHAYASAQREQYELEAHKKALESYGMDTNRLGANQHTWYTSSLSGSQSMAAIRDAGLYWQSGFAASGSPATVPQSAAENVVSLPFFLMENGNPTLLIQNNSTLMYKSELEQDISARYQMPMCIYYHCDFAYASDSASHNALKTVQAFREKYHYNFNREDQLIQASACALHQQVRAEGSLQDAGGVTISPFQHTANFPLNDENVNRSLGVRVVFSEKINTANIRADADIWYWDGHALVLGLNRNVSFSMGSPASAQPHLRRINMAADVTMTDTGALIQFRSGGMMEAAVQGNATTDTPGWNVIHRENETIFIKYGSAESLNLIF